MHQTKKIFCSLLFLLSGLLLTAQTIENPTFKARNGSIRNITRIERTPECTKVYIHAIFRPHWWIMEDGDSYLEDAATGKRYAQTGAEGIQLKEKTVMPDSGTTDFVLLFEPLPADVQTVHLIAPNSTESNTYDISLVPAPKNKQPLKPVKGNWFADDAQGRWAYGIYDSLVIADNRLYDLKTFHKKGKRLVLAAQSRADGSSVTLQLTPRKDGSCLIALDGGEAQRYVRTRPDTPAVEADNGYGDDFFRNDSVCLQGYLDGYDPRLGFDSGILYLEDNIISQEYPVVVPIKPDGSFQCKFVLQHPICHNLLLNNNWVPYYAEPGDTVTLYLSWEDLMARSRARDNSYPLPHTAHMGRRADLSYLATTLKQSFYYPYDKLSKAQKTLTPAQFQEQLKPVVAQWQQQADSLCRLYAPSQKAVSLIRNQMAMQVGSTYLNFQMSRNYYAQQDSTNRVLQVQPDASYYNFLKEMPLNEQSALANSNISTFINRFEYMNPLDAAYSTYAHLSNEETFKALPVEEQQILLQMKLCETKDSIINSLCATPSPLLWQVARIRNLRFTLSDVLKRRQDAEVFLSRVEKTLTHPYLRATARNLMDELCPETRPASYQLPEGKATDIFRRIIAPHAGKVLFVDFWATTCGPCRGGIQATADLRKQYRNHPEFQFVYITSETESPEKSYTDYVEKHLKGEACYRLTDTEYKYMRQLFQFNGIPHYVVVEKDGSISTEEVGTHNLADFLKRRFGDKQ
ncbi:TlpA disulfide reductase family protein [Mediterranea massiliensis]|uniref:TlpA family protein disulfide reductase n=1 Tax=Mediterranea massiliensis TaxID=1841865 RepID=UPI003207E9B7